jgi:hypothetical protein
VLVTKQRFVLESSAALDTQEIRQLEAVREDADLLWRHLQEPDVTDVTVRRHRARSISQYIVAEDHSSFRNDIAVNGGTCCLCTGYRARDNPYYR